MRARSTCRISPFGFAQPGTSVATVLHDRVTSRSRAYRDQRDVLLGYVIARRDGPPAAAAELAFVARVMRPVINMEEAAAKRLRFTREQGEQIVRRIETSSLALATH